MVTIGENYVERVEKALVESLILSELRRGDRSLDELERRVLDVRGWDEDVDDDFVEDCAKRLDRQGRIEGDDDRYHLTDRGRSEADRVEALLCNVTTGMAGAGAATGLPP